MSPARIIVPILLLVVGLLAGWVGHAVLAAPPDVPRVSLYDDWRVDCPKLSDKKGSCSLVQDVIDTKAGREIAHLSLVDSKAGRQLTITVPYDVLLPSGVGLALGKDKIRVYPYRTCGTNGCIAQVTVDDALVKALRPQRDAKLLLAQLDNRVAALPFSLKGFARAEDAYTSDHAKRAGWLARVLP
jgi:invasion protein IalB